ncbi:hypothetical protein AWM70_08665 [Paenibacillus yonginensis]|uniref:Uncharacterized protein n=1 Tax=Paenibacillus yonginensis TaxID=1462996 RepID=A0A1B1MZR1_9BACL|nr:hypothetical protein [Paenibacillus yonginensis]ANS74649.1 hypothetical protein AWM70_08665 [Paenibacillus yonginensis]
MKKKSFLTILPVVAVTVIILLAVSTQKENVTSSASVDNISQHVNLQDTNLQDNVSPSRIGNKWSGHLSGSKQTSSSFDVPKGYGHVQLRFLNQGTSEAVISVAHEGSGKEYFTKTIAAGESLVWTSDADYTQGMRSGYYILSFRSSSSYVDVDYSGMASDLPQNK